MNDWCTHITAGSLILKIGFGPGTDKVSPRLFGQRLAEGLWFDYVVAQYTLPFDKL